MQRLTLCDGDQLELKTLKEAELFLKPLGTTARTLRSTLFTSMAKLSLNSMADGPGFRFLLRKVGECNFWKHFCKL